MDQENNGYRPGEPVLYEEPPAPRRICGFRKRVAALVIDGVILAAGGYGLGVFLFDAFAAMGDRGRLVGFVIALVYFGLLNSSIGYGQTLGKRAVRIKVVNHHDETVSPPRAALRFAVLGAPFFLAPLAAPQGGALVPGGILINAVVFGLGGAIVYLYLFNRETRQSVHDLIVGTYVARASAEAELEVSSMWKGHLLVAGLWIVAVVLISPILTATLTDGDLPDDLLSIKQRIEATAQVHAVSLRRIQTSTSGVWTGFLRVEVRWKERPDFERAAAEVARIILENYKGAEQLDTVLVEVRYGYNIGIARSFRTQRYKRNAEAWGERIGGL